MRHVDSLEHRKLFAATSTLTDGIVRVVGTDESEKIEVRHLYKLTLGEAASGANETTSSVQVLVDGKEVATYSGADVKRVNVFGLGGRDTIIGPASSSSARGTVQVWTAGNDAATPVPITRIASAPAFRMYVEGGSGNDRIVGGHGNDWLYGGRGNDTIVDKAGRNLIDGGAGDDTLDANDGATTVGEFARVHFTNRNGDTFVSTDYAANSTTDYQYISDGKNGGRIVVTTDDGQRMEYVGVPAAIRSTPDTVVGGEGNDTAIVNGDDVVSGVETKRTAVTLGRFGEGKVTIGDLVNAAYVPAWFKVESVVRLPEGNAVFGEDGKALMFDGKLFDAAGLKGKDGGVRGEDILKLVQSGEGLRVDGEYKAGSILHSEVGLIVLNERGTKAQYKGKEYDVRAARGKDGGFRIDDLIDLIEGRRPPRGS